MPKFPRLLGLALLCLATLVFLKLNHVAPVAQWSWWAITSALWGPWLLVLLVALGIVVVKGRKASRA